MLDPPAHHRNLHAVLRELLPEIRDLYLADQVPWVIGYSGGKDSTLTTALVWMALAGLTPKQRTTVHVISTDTLVENPVIAGWVQRSLTSMRTAAAEQALPIEVHRLTPKVADTFWVNLIGNGYAAPRPRFRWCTERPKIRPSNDFIHSVVDEHGQAILVLGTRKPESTARALTMAKHEKGRVRDRLSPNGSLPNSLVYTPIEDLSTDEVWTLLMQYPNPWGHSHKELLALYRGASEDNECPLVVDTTTPSCGTSRFGCWTCTMVQQDKSMQAMILNEAEYDWMQPLLDLRNALDVQDDRHLRDFRRMNGSLLIHRDRLVHGPYTQQAREDWLRRLLRAQTWVRANGPDHVRDLTLITVDELHEIRRIWVFTKHEVEDTLPSIYQDATGEPFPGKQFDDMVTINRDMIGVLRDVCGDDEQQFLTLRALLATERTYRTAGRRAGLFDALTKVLGHHFDNEDEALNYALWQREMNGQDPDQRALF
ncbi:DNA phosphorothioation system sulfurtransferase DndC [Streptomyces sp. S.PB5]|uniref:DNA phosphorothioation system sulfurtransferase DndC n=1 Tax=Streptomyces sp. S.PB5 TaxID=3020844 RepID=UPI0025B0FF09|nr:DNA phosphorothioation system sulfurtransferase DndC [Streptomyces sp. S.PB5]MDN3025722.1 DNA phosphorothioation system sulfurtransferase DndC [Streptomyces sp. S.PB5]